MAFMGYDGCSVADNKNKTEVFKVVLKTLKYYPNHIIRFIERILKKTCILPMYIIYNRL